MYKIEKTLKHTNKTYIEEDADITPALKEGFSIFCQTQGVGEDVSSVVRFNKPLKYMKYLYVL